MRKIEKILHIFVLHILVYMSPSDTLLGTGGVGKKLGGLDELQEKWEQGNGKAGK